MKVTKGFALAVVVMMFTAAITGYAQGTARDRITFNINTRFELRMGDYVLPPGKYILQEVDATTSPDMFALYKENRMQSPIAMIQTTRIRYNASEYPDKSQIILVFDPEDKVSGIPTLTGWKVPGKDGWRVTGVVEKEKGHLTRR